MDEEDRERLKLNLSALANDLHTEHILPYLLQEDIISQDVWDEIEAVQPNTRKNKTLELLKILPTRGERAYKVFCEALDEGGYDFLRKTLDETEVKIVRREDWLDNLPENVRSRPPKDEELNRLAKNLGSNWEEIAVSLGLSSVQIDQLKMQHGTMHMPTLIFRMFSKWKGVKGKAATWDVLLKCLISCQVAPSAYESVIAV